ncbi:unnamed protein product [Linum tenue]|uniref:Uncharacterized protein n=1 Tax=Linum tenue TaxID=586396 RepID=A0AAV0R9R7_9ROSI|nr:unnamed protein product [Linum tenue]
MKFARPVKYTAPSLFFRSSFPLSSTGGVWHAQRFMSPFP